MFQATTERGKKAHLVYINAYEKKNSRMKNKQ